MSLSFRFCLTIFVTVFSLHSLAAPSVRTVSKKHRTSAGRIAMNEVPSDRQAIQVVDRTSRYFPHWEIRTAPIALFAQWLTLDVSYRLTENFAFGPAMIFYGSPRGQRGSMFTPAFNGWAVGANANYYFNTVQNDGWYTGAHLYYQNYFSYGHGTSEGDSSEFKGIKADNAWGYQWKVFKRMTVLLGGGLAYQSQDASRYRVNSGSPTTTNERESYLGPFIEFKMGIEI